MSRIGSDDPTISSNIEEWTISSRNATASFLTRSSACLRGRRRELPDNLSAFVEYWVILKKQPAKLAMFTQQPLFRLDGIPFERPAEV